MRKLHQNQYTMKTKGLFTLIALVCCTHFTMAQFALGDIAFSAYNADAATPDDAFTIVLLRAVTNGEAITFNENGWFAHLGGFRSGESVCTLTFGNDYPAGTQVTISRVPFVAVDQDNNSAGTMSGSGLNLAGGGDSIIAYDAGSSPTLADESGLVAAINMTGEWRTPDGMDSSTTTEKPATLVDGTHAVSIEPEIDNARFAALNCPGSMLTSDALRTLLHTASNWETDNGTPYAQVPPVCNFVPTLGLSDIDAEAAMQVYPNPVENLMYLDPAAYGMNPSVIIYDLSGREVLVPKTIENGAVDLSTLSTGVYIAKVNAAAIQVTQKFVKQ